MQQPTQDSPKIIEFIGDVFSNASELPEDLKQKADQINQWWIDVSGQVQQEKDKTAAEIEDNIRSNAIAGYGEQAARFLSKPGNLVVSFLGLIGIVLILKRF